MDRQTELQQQYTRNAEEHFLKLKSVDDLLDILADKYGVQPPSEQWFKGGKRTQYKSELIKLILACKFGE